MKYSFTPDGVCSRNIDFEIENGKVKNVCFTAGCNGNLKALANLVEGQDANAVIEKLKGITCGQRKTSCADQFARALKEHCQN